MARDVICSHKVSGGDYSDPATWEVDTQVDLTAAATLAFTHSGTTGSLPNGTDVEGQTSSARGTIVCQNKASGDDTILLTVDSGTFNAGGEVIGKFGDVANNQITSTDGGDQPICILEGYDKGSAFAQGVSIGGATTSATNYRHIRAAAGEGHNGFLDQGYRYEKSSSALVGLVEHYARLTDLNIYPTWTGGGSYAVRCFLSGYASNFTIINVIGQSQGTLGVFFMEYVSATALWLNCLAVHHANGDGFYAKPSVATLYNCTAIATGNTVANTTGLGFENYNAALVRNCVSLGFGGASFENVSWHASSSHNAGDDAYVPGSNVVTTSLAEAAFFDYDNNIFLGAIGSVLDKAGVDLSSTGFDHDIQGHVREGTREDLTWDCGSHNSVRETVRAIRISGATLPSPDYNDLSSWEAAEQRDLVAVDEWEVAEGYDDWVHADGLHDKVAVTGWTLDQYRGITIRAASGEEHDGTPSSGWRFYMTWSSGLPLDVYEENFHIETTMIRRSRDPAQNEAIKFNATSGIVYVDRVVARSNGSDANVITGHATGDLQITNTITIGGDDGIYLGTPDSFAYNCLAQGAVIGFNKAAFEAPALRNCVSMGNTTSWGQLAYTAWGGNNNAASDGNSITPPGTAPITTDVVTSDFIDDGGFDFNLVASGTTLVDTGSGVGIVFTLDIAGTTRDGTWDIGPYAQTFAASGGQPIYARHNTIPGMKFNHIGGMF